MTMPRKWRISMWAAATVLLALPAITMQFSDTVAWGPEDFAIFAVLLGIVCLTVELAARTSNHFSYLAGVSLAAVGGLMLVFINLAVGVIGEPDNLRNLAFFAIPLLGFLGALVGHFRPMSLIRVLVVMTVIQISAAFLAPAEMMHVMIPFTGAFVGLWLLSAFLIRRSTHP